MDNDAQSHLLRALSERLGDKVSLACETVTDATGLFDAEKPAIAKAIPKRQAEFAAGRRAARSALQALDAPGAAIIPDGARAPIWPAGIVGSITHDQGVAFAAVAQSHDIAAIGIDATKAAPLPGRTRDAILRTQSEQALNDLEARAAFAVKECLFKALYPDVQSFFGFEAAIATPNIEGQNFTATLTTDLGTHPKGASFSGVLMSTKALIVTVLAIAA